MAQPLPFARFAQPAGERSALFPTRGFSCDEWESTPLGDFVGIGLGETVAFQSVLFSNPEVRSFNSFVPMPFRTGMRMVMTNETDTDLMALYYDVDYTVGDKLGSDVLSFHAYFRRENPTRCSTNTSRSLANCRASRSPSTIARRMAIPVTASMSDTALCTRTRAAGRERLAEAMKRRWAVKRAGSAVKIRREARESGIAWGREFK
jgi:hypothetical protein